MKKLTTATTEMALPAFIFNFEQISYVKSSQPGLSSNITFVRN